MDKQTLNILALLIFLAPVATLAGFILFMNFLKKTRPARKRLQAQITSNKVKEEKLQTQKTQKWLRVGEYDIFVHRVTEQLHISDQKRKQVIYIEVEYRNQSQVENLSCRRNQWRVYSAEGNSYEAEAIGIAYLFREKHYFGSENLINPGMNVRGWFAFILPEGAKIRFLQFMTAFIGTKTAAFDIEDSIEIEEPLVETQKKFPNQVQLIEKEYGKINRAANDFLLKLPEDNIKQAISLSAEMAGLKLLRTADIDLSKFEPGTVVLGAVSDETYQQMQRFMFNWAISNRLDPRNAGNVELLDDDKNYFIEVAQLEDSFDEICRQNNILQEHFPFAAASAALKLVLAGKKMDLLDENTGRALTLYHIILGGKTIPYHPRENDPQPRP